MRIFVSALKSSDGSLIASFFGHDVVEGWVHIRDNTGFDKVYCIPELSFNEAVHSANSSEMDLVIEENDLATLYKGISSYIDAVKFVDLIIERIEHGGNC